jgi:diphthamide synthase (EF-2-diphthine--ammonia ligase)
MSWSSGKDSALALHEVRSAGEIDVTGLLTTVDTAAGRVAMHGVRRVLLEAQAAALGLPLHVIELPWPCPNPVYEQLMSQRLAAARQQDVSQIIFGDLFLADIRAYREASLAGTGLTPVFPLWQRPTGELAREILTRGIRAVITCVDPCGENGEFHTFVTDGPGFAYPLEVTLGDTVERDGFVFTDVLPSGHQVAADLRRGHGTPSGTARSTEPGDRARRS